MRAVLIVEDDPAMLRGLEDNFKMKGYYVLTAMDGVQALATALKEKPDLILLDIMLPEMNGYEVCSHVREKGLDMPIIMLTAKDRESDIVLGLNLGADDSDQAVQHQGASGPGGGLHAPAEGIRADGLRVRRLPGGYHDPYAPA
jgi:CheY-like chemotaxis protein